MKMKLSFRQFVLREQLKSKWKIVDFLFGNNYDNNRNNYNWMLNILKESTFGKESNNIEEWEEWLNKKLNNIK